MADRRTGDTKPILEGSTGTDLTGAAVLIHLVRPDGTLVSRAPVIAAGTTGGWTLAFLAGELELPGVYQYEAEATDGTGGVQTTRYPGFRVERQLDGGNPLFAPFSIVDNGDGSSTLTWS